MLISIKVLILIISVFLRGGGGGWGKMIFSKIFW